MKQVLISYSHDDKDFVDKLKKDLERLGVKVVIDEDIVIVGESLMMIFSEMGSSSALLPVFSNSAINSRWVLKEVRVAVIRAIQEEDFKVIPIIKSGENWEELHGKMPSDLREALRDTRFARFDRDTWESCIQEIVQAISSEHDPQEVYSKIEGPRSDNPFRRVRTEYFEDVQVLARSFEEPESTRYDRISELKPTIIEGGRGSGKTMVLKSLQAVISILRGEHSSFRDAQIKHFGVYCRLQQGSFAVGSSDILNYVPHEVAIRLFTSEITLRLVQALIFEIQECVKYNIFSITSRQENDLIRNLIEQIRPEMEDNLYPGDLEALERFIRIELQLVNDYVGRRIFGEALDYKGVFLGKDELRGFCSGVIQTIQDLENVTIYFLLDEYENLMPWQMVVLNTLVKWSESGHFTVKIATKNAGFQDPQTLEGQEIEESHDYSLVDMDYNISKSEHRKYYRNLLKKVTKNILSSEGFEVCEIDKLLEVRSRYNGIDEKKISKIISTIVKNQTGKELSEIHEPSQKEYYHRLEIGAIYRALNSKRKQFAGVDDFVLLSSGIIRYFLELCGASYYFARQDNVDVKKGNHLSIKHQTDAAYSLSSYYLDTIRKNVAEYGEQIQQFIIDLGNIFRHKLLNHQSEPEAARISILDPHSLEAPSMKKLRDILYTTEIHTYLQADKGIGGIKPKHATEVQPREYLLNRIFAPELQFSPRTRWRTKFSCQELSDLLDIDKRKKTKAQLITKVAKIIDYDPKSAEDQVELFDQDETEGTENDIR